MILVSMPPVESPDTLVFVPAIMGAGLVFSVAAVLRDVLFRGSRTMQERRARIRGAMLAETIERPESPNVLSAARAAHRPSFVLAGLVSCAFAVYIAVGTTGNFLRAEGYVNRIAWLWGGSLVVVGVALYFSVVCLVVAVRPEHPPFWVWSTLLQTPLLGVEPGRGASRTRWVVISSLTVLTLLTILATWPHVLDPFDRRAADLIDAGPIAQLDRLTVVLGSTRFTLVIAVLVGMATLRCKRFAWVFISSVVVSLVVTAVLRLLVDRPRPDAIAPGAETSLLGDGSSFPSGHMVQITLLATLVPLALYEMTRSPAMRRWSTLALAVCVILVGIGRVAIASHGATDVIAGIALGLAVGSWARLALQIPESHRECRACAAADMQNERTRR